MNQYCNYLNFPYIDVDLTVYKKNKRNLEQIKMGTENIKRKPKFLF